MKKLLYILLLLIPLASQAQRIEIVWVEKESGVVKRVPNNQRLTTDEEKAKYSEYFALFAYGMPRAMVKKNSEMRASIYKFTGNGNSSDVYECGVTQRHHTTKGHDFEITDGTNGYNANQKITFGFLIAPHNVKRDGTTHEEGAHTDWEEELDWATASGWDATLNTESAKVEGLNYYGGTRYADRGKGEGNSTLNATEHTGCSAYQGIDGKDPQGSWRLPTQREAQVMFTIIEQALEMNGGTGDDEHEAINHIVDGTYWTSTEFCGIINQPWKVWSLESKTGACTFMDKTSGNYARCIRDIYMDINN